MDIVANYAAGEEVVGAFFGGNQSKNPGDEAGTSPQGAKRNGKNKNKKKGQRGKREATDDDLVAAVERKKPRGPPEGAVFDKMLEEPCPYHKGGTDHKLKDCRMLRRHFERLNINKEGEKKEQGATEVTQTTTRTKRKRKKDSHPSTTAS